MPYEAGLSGDLLKSETGSASKKGKKLIWWHSPKDPCSLKVVGLQNGSGGGSVSEGSGYSGEQAGRPIGLYFPWGNSSSWP